MKGYFGDYFNWLKVDLAEFSTLLSLLLVDNQKKMSPNFVSVTRSIPKVLLQVEVGGSDHFRLVYDFIYIEKITVST